MSHKDNHTCINHEHFINMMIYKLFLSYFKILLRYSYYGHFISVTRSVFLINRVLISYVNFIPATSSECRSSHKDSFIGTWEVLKSLYLFFLKHVYISEKIIKFMLHKYVIFIKHIHEITCHSKTCLFISHMWIFILWKIWFY